MKRFILRDLWQSLSKHSHIALTCHFINSKWEMKNYTLSVEQLPVGESHDNVLLRDTIKRICREYDIKHAGMLVHDQGANIILAGTKMVENSEIEASGNCFSHTLHLVVDSSLEKIANLEKKASNLASKFSYAHVSEKLTTDP